ncbi:hypothetical protein L0669_19285 [Flavobacterium bizetiae]|uniref:hypothetical protein n=1 Tax=Flavobacterium bizetiae TaxID=2704140 RepID=UPI0021E7A51D|nr:hypothetical protein [Flavobacterium bizetiae]UTN03468.1 hypothetical protein L0669_19285 [Flavobacterium bizetiae]
MKKYNIIWMFFIFSNLFAQNEKYDQIKFENIILNNHNLYFGLKRMPSLEKYLGQIEKKKDISNDKIKIPLTKNQIGLHDFSNKKIMLFITKDSAFIHYFNFEKSKKRLIIKFNQKKTILSNNYKLVQFKKDFPASYKFAKGINATPLSKAAFIPVLLFRPNCKGYMCFTFYDGKLIDIFISDYIPKAPY